MNTSSQHNQPFAPQPKKTNWGMIILLLILIPVLILGFIFGYKKLMDEPNAQNTVQNNNPTQQNNNSNANPSSPITGDWYFEDNGNAPKWFYVKYSFAAPQPSSGGNPKGTVTMAWDDGMYQEKTQNYELINDRTIRITDPNDATAPPYQIEYAYNAGGQTLEISDQGTRLTYLRNPTATYNASINKNNSAPTSNNNNTAQQNNNNNVNTSQLPPVGFDQPKTPANFNVPTSWSNAYEKGNVVISVIPKQNGSKISGEIDCQFFDNNGNYTGDALWYFKGSINGNVANINVTDLKGNLETKGTLTLSGSKLIFSMNKKAGLLPKYASLSAH